MKHEATCLLSLSNDGVIHFRPSRVVTDLYHSSASIRSLVLHSVLLLNYKLREALAWGGEFPTDIFI